MKRIIFPIVLVAAVMISFRLSAKANAEDGPQAWVGKAAPKVSLTMLDGKKFELSALKGKVVVMDIWATWCPPCRKSLPHLQALSADKDLAKKGLLVVAVNHGEDKPTITGFMDQNKFNFPVALDTAMSLLQKLNGQGIPTTLVVGREGVIKNVFIGYGKGSDEKLKEAIDSALSENSVQQN